MQVKNVTRVFAASGHLEVAIFNVCLQPWKRHVFPLSDREDFTKTLKYKILVFKKKDFTCSCESSVLALPWVYHSSAAEK